MKKTSIITITAFASLLGLFSLVNFITPQKKMSENENRYLTQFPKPTVETVFDGSFEREFESYMNDQIVFRDEWITLKQETQRLMGNSKLNGVYLGKDGYLIEAITKESVNWEQYEKNSRSIRDFLSETGLSQEHQTVVIVPTSGLILKDKLPKNAPMADQDELLDQWKSKLMEGRFIDVRKPLSVCESSYYKTDHHWTTDGAYQAYLALCREQGKKETLVYDRSTVSEDFLGTLYSKALLPWAPDSIVLYKNKSQDELRVTGDEEKISLYNPEALKTKSKYDIFLGGNYGEVTISTKVKNRGKLLVIKDSYANSFVPFLTGDYAEIRMLDLRYYQGSAQEYVKENKITDILFLYGIKNMLEDTNLPKLGL